MKLVYSVLIITLFFGVLFFSNPTIASASILTLTPGNTSLGVGSTKSFRVVLNTEGESVNAVSAVLVYPEDLIEVRSISPSSTLGVQAEQTFGGGNINISRGNINPVQGVVTVATITLKGKAAGGATVYFTRGSAAPRASDSSDSLDLSRSIGSVISVGGTGGGTTTSSTSKSTLPVAGNTNQTLLFVIGGVFLTLLGGLGVIFIH